MTSELGWEESLNIKLNIDPEALKTYIGTLVDADYPLELHEEPSAASRMKTMIPAGTPVMLLDCVLGRFANKWFKILYGDEVGYVRARFRACELL